MKFCRFERFQVKSQNFGGVYSRTVLGNDLATQVQILDEAVCISLYTNAFYKRERILHQMEQV